MRIPGIIRIIRPVNSCISGAAAGLAYFIATGSIVPDLWAPMLVVLLITGAGNTVNDLFDLDIDRVNRPDRPIPSGQVTRRQATAVAGVLFATGVAISLMTNIYCILIAVFNSFLLIWYAARIKRLPLLGNIVVSYLSASIFLFGGAYAGPSAISQNLPIIGITFLAMLSREILKDIEDIEGDRAGGAQTLPIVAGIRRSVMIAAIAATGAVLASLLPVGSWWGPHYLTGIAVADGVIIMAAFRAVRCTSSASVRKSRATDILKGGMFTALLVFAIAAAV
ncbi:MAG: geranylgeranylglycerol-phosphate geranylgeranyltransferase [Methanoculleaceae archaeon]